MTSSPTDRRPRRLLRAAAAILLSALLALTVSPAGAAPPPGGDGGGEDPVEEDLNPPRVVITADRPSPWQGWYDADVTLRIQAFDDQGSPNDGLDAVGYRLGGASTGTGVVDNADGSSITVSNAGVTTLVVEAFDVAGNLGRAEYSVGIDRTRPSVHFGGRLAETVRIFAPGEPVTADYSCGDVGTEVASCSGTVAHGALLDTATVGDHAVTVTARDRVGNTTTSAASYRVQDFFTISGSNTVVGTPAVGQTLRSGITGIWPTPTTTRYQWVRNGTEVVGTSPTYVVTAADRGSQLHLGITIARDGVRPNGFGSHAVTVPLDPITVSQDPVLEGEAVVGRGLWVWQPRPTIEPATAHVDYAWFRDGERIDTSTSGSPQFHGLTAADQGRRISLVVTVSAPGHTTRRWELGPSDPVRGRPLEVQGVPTVAGAARVGSVLTARAPIIRELPLSRDPGDPAELTYQWLRGGVPIPGATAVTYRPGLADVGRRLAVRVTGTATGHEPAAVTSAPTSAVAKATPTLRAAVRVRGRGRVRLTVSATAPGTPVTGVVTVRRGRTVVLRRALEGGALTAVLQRQPRGRVTYTVAYAGSSGVVARTVKVKARVR